MTEVSPVFLLPNDTWSRLMVERVYQRVCCWEEESDLLQVRAIHTAAIGSTPAPIETFEREVLHADLRRKR
jgi:hypothetical protein